MADSSGLPPPGWYYAPGDPLGTQRYWDGRQWVGDPQWMPAAPPAPGYAYAGDAGRSYIPELGRTLADPGRRIVARIIDALLIGIICSFPIALYLASRDDLDFDSVQRWSIFTVAVTALYDITLVALKGATVGKLAMGIEVIRQDGTSPPGWKTAFLRQVVELIAVLPGIFGFVNFVLTVVSFVFLFTDHRRRTINDRIATTYVVNRRPQWVPQQQSWPQNPNW